MKAAPENYMIKTVARAMDLLDQFREGDAEFGITDLSNRLKLQKNNVFRLVSTLSAKKYIEINSYTGKYRLGIRARSLGQLAAEHGNLVHHARPILHDLKLQCHETCSFSVHKDGYVCCLEGVESDLPVRVVQSVGKSRSLHGTAAGRVLLAFMEVSQQMDLLATSVTRALSGGVSADLDMLRHELHTIAGQGYAVDDQEAEAGVMEIAVPVFDGNGIIVGALSIAGPKMRIEERLESEVLPLLRQIAARFSALLGYCRDKEAPSETASQKTQTGIKARKIEMNPYIYGGLKACC